MSEANMLMKMHEWDDAVSYRVGCQCTDTAHDLDIWVETDKENDFPAIYLSSTIHTNLWNEQFTNPFLKWLNGPLNRIILALAILLNGKIEMHKEFILGKENVKGLRTALDEIEKKFT